MSVQVKGSGTIGGLDEGLVVSGIVTASTQINVGSNIKVGSAGVVTATTFSGSGASLTNIPDSALSTVTASKLTGALPAISGANLTNLDASDLASGTVPTARLGSGTANSSTFLAGDSTFKTVTGTTINNNGSNRIITGSSTANTLEGESTFTYDGTSVAKIDTSQTYATFQLDGNAGGAIEFYENGTRRFEIYGVDAEVSLYDRDKGAFHTRFKSGGNLELSDGKLLIGTTNEGEANADDLTIATTGHTGITLRSGTSNYGQMIVLV